MRHRLLAGLALCASLLTAPAAFAQSVQELVKKGTVQIGVISGAPPFGTVSDTPFSTRMTWS